VLHLRRRVGAPEASAQDLVTCILFNSVSGDVAQWVEAALLAKRSSLLNSLMSSSLCMREGGLLCFLLACLLPVLLHFHMGGLSVTEDSMVEAAATCAFCCQH
jgi:hypothetical protein